MNSDELNSAVDEPSPAYEDEYVSLILRDGLDLPIADLQVFVTMPSGEICQATTTVQGAVTVPISKPRSGMLKVAVQDAQGNKHDVCTLDAARCKDVVIVRSPKTAGKTKLRVHQEPVAATKPAVSAKPKNAGHHTQPGSAPAAPASAANAPASGAPSNSSLAETQIHWWSANGSLAKAWSRLTDAGHINQELVSIPPGFLAQLRNAIGQPLDLMAGPECPNKDNLRLGRNNTYRQDVLDAAKRLGLIPQAMCGLVECEAGKISEKIPVLDKAGNPVKDKKGKPVFNTITELWNAHSGNASSNAAGLTQFLRNTWLSHIFRPGFFIHDESVKAGWVKQEKSSKGGSQWVFVLADDSTTADPHKHLSDANVKACLAKRMDPRWSLLAAADYGRANLQVAIKAGFKVDGLNDMDKAKLMYVMHHEGEGAGPLFVRNTLAPNEAGKKALKKKFAQQLARLPKSDGTEEAQKLIDASDGDVEAAYRKWLADYVEKKFRSENINRFFCSGPIEATALTKLMKQVGGEPL